MIPSAAALSEPDAPLSPVGCLSLLWPAVDDCLVSAAERVRLEADAARLARVSRVALELRLGAGDHDVDLHQLFTARDADAANLKLSLAGPDHAAARNDAIGGFLAAWADNVDGLRTEVETVYLEWDRPGEEGITRPPAIFLPVQRRDQRSGAADQRFRILEHIRRHGLGGKEAGRLIAAVFDAIPESLSISFIGLMAGRADAVRINLRQIRPDDLAGVLEQIGWPGDIDLVTPHFRKLVERTGQVAVALDFSPALQPTIGFEAMLDSPPEIEPRWQGLFDMLCTAGLCTEQKRSALLAAGAARYPEDPDQDWPTAWMAAAAMAPGRFVPWVEQRISHVKISIAADGVPTAKAYLSAQHFWIRPGHDSAVTRSPAAPGGSLKCARDRAARFLLANRSQDDFWRDFQISNGPSDEWVTAFVGCALAGRRADISADILHQAARALARRQRPGGGWGYNEQSPADADSTAWALKFLRMIGWSGPEAEAGMAFLRSHVRPDGGLATYQAATPIRFGDGSREVDDRGWRTGHLCVAANAAALLEHELTPMLVSSQSPEGCWIAYWWRSDTLATALAVEALPAANGAERRRAVAWARGRDKSTRSAFDRAWLIRILGQGDPADHRRARALAKELALEQHEDGGWDASAEMLWTDPSGLARSPKPTPCPDHRRLFTTASVVMAIDHVLQAGASL